MAKIDRYKVKDNSEEKIQQLVRDTRARSNVISCEYKLEGDEWVVTTEARLRT